MQEVIDNIMICRVEHRSESDPEVQPHVHHKQIQLEVGGCGLWAGGEWGLGRRLAQEGSGPERLVQSQ